MHKIDIAVRKITKSLVHKVVILLYLTAQLSGISLLFPHKLEGANLSTVSDTLSNNRLSFRGSLNGAVAAGSGLLVLNTSVSLPYTSTGSSALMSNESVKVGTNAPIAIKTLETATRVFLGTALTTAASSGDPVVATVSAIHTVVFTPVSVISGGSFRVLIPAYTTTSYNPNDGLPDPNGFDYNAITSSVLSCTGGGSNITFPGGSANTATNSAVTIGSTTYHAFECRYTGSGAAPSAVTMTIGTAAGTKLINPSPASTTRYPGQADTYTFRVQHLDIGDSYSVTDQTIGTIGVVEAVKVTATVAPTLTFQITGIGNSGSDPTTCGITNTSRGGTTTPFTAPFGTISTTAFTDLAHLLNVSTNAGGGYVVTASESAALTAFNVTGSPTISDTTCGGSCTTSTPAEWNTASQKGFGYSLQDVSGTPVSNVSATLPYNYSGRTFNARPFGTVAKSIMTNTTVVDSEQAYVCYRIIVSGTQQAGDYENYIVYIATATF